MLGSSHPHRRSPTSCHGPSCVWHGLVVAIGRDRRSSHCTLCSSQHLVPQPQCDVTTKPSYPCAQISPTAPLSHAHPISLSHCLIYHHSHWPPSRLHIPGRPLPPRCHGPPPHRRLQVIAAEGEVGEGHGEGWVRGGCPDGLGGLGDGIPREGGQVREGPAQGTGRVTRHVPRHRQPCARCCEWQPPVTRNAPLCH